MRRRIGKSLIWFDAACLLAALTLASPYSVIALGLFAASIAVEAVLII